ncbi:phosphoribosyltransferase [Candidatus Hodarchaeum mangrovi]
MIIENLSFRNKYYIFNSRRKAGSLLGSYVGLESFDLLLLIPNGGIPVGLGIVEFPLVPRTKIDLLIVRKIQIPGNTEAGMGAITPDGQVFLNDMLLDRLAITTHQLETQIERTKYEIEKKRREFTGTSHKLEVYGKNILIVDDGVASGFSVLAASSWLRQLGAETIILAVPTAPISSLKRLEKVLDKIICLNVREKFPFAVADAYTNWYDVSDLEAKDYFSLLKEFQPLLG